MNNFASSLFALGVLSTSLHAQTSAVCPNKAVFLVLPDQVRAYASAADGNTAPCQVISGAATTLFDGNSIAISAHGFPRTTQFLSGPPVTVFTPNATGNAIPYRSEGVGGDDLMSIATDGTNDYVLRANGGGQAFVDITHASKVAYTFAVPGVFALKRAGGVALSIDKNLIVAGYDSTGTPLVETLSTAANPGSPAVLRTISGPLTRLLPQSPNDFLHNSLSVATNPVTGEISVYSYSDDFHSQQISVFPALANGDVPPSRVIFGPSTGIGAPGLKNNKIAVGADGRLYDAESNNTILVFAPDARGNTAPIQTIVDPSAPQNADFGQAGIAVRQ